MYIVVVQSVDTRYINVIGMLQKKMLMAANNQMRVFRRHAISFFGALLARNSVVNESNS